METNSEMVSSFGGSSISSVMKKMSKWLKMFEEDTFILDVVVDTDCADDGRFYGRIVWDEEGLIESEDVEEFDEEEWQAEQDKNQEDAKCFTCEDKMDCPYYADLLKEIEKEEYTCDKCEFVDDCKELWHKGRCVDSRKYA